MDNKNQDRLTEPFWAKIGFFFVKLILGNLIKFLWVDKVKGMENIPKKGAAIVASNHESFFDFLCFLSVSPRKVHYLAAEKFFNNKLWKPLMLISGQIKVDRKSKNKSEVHNKVLSVLRQEKIIGIFPEGTRSPDGFMHPPYTGVAKYALKAKVPIIPVGIKGTYEIMSRYDKKPKLGKKADIIIGEPMYFDEYYGEGEDREILKSVTHQVMLKIADLTGKQYKHGTQDVR